MDRLQTPLNTIKLFVAKCFIILYQRTWKMYFISSQDFVIKKVFVILYSKAFRYLRYKKGVYWWKSKNKVFYTWKNSKNHSKYKKMSSNFFLWFSITTIDSICFMKMLWSISTHWCFKKFIDSGLPQFNTTRRQMILPTIRRLGNDQVLFLHVCLPWNYLHRFQRIQIPWSVPEEKSNSI